MHLLTMRNLALNPKRAFPFDQIPSKFNLLVAYWLKGTPMDRPTLFSQIIVKIEVCNLENFISNIKSITIVNHDHEKFDLSKVIQII